MHRVATWTTLLYCRYLQCGYGMGAADAHFTIAPCLALVMRPAFFHPSVSFETQSTNLP